MRCSEGKFNVLVVVMLIALLAIAGVPVIWNSKSAYGASNANLVFRVIEYKHDSLKHDTVKVVYDHRHIMNLDRNVTELQTKLGSAGWVPVGEVSVKAGAVPSGCIIRVLVSEKEQDMAPQSKYTLEGCAPSMSLASILFSPRTAGYSIGTYGYSGYRLVMQSR